jgi:4-hydroxy-3-polyprenylbenzoate decarboxylase
MLNLRQFISALDEAGSLHRISEQVDWRVQLGQMSQQSGSPMLFEAVKDYPHWKIFTGGFSRLRFIAVALGLDAGISKRELILAMRERLTKPLPPILTRQRAVDTFLTDKKVNLFDLPVPQWSEIDAGRYVGTWHINITKDPETLTRNLGIYRMLILNKNQTTLSVSPRSHLAMHMEKAERAGHPLEMAVAIGVAEPIIMAAAAALPNATDELTVAGGLMCRPVEIVKCNTVDLEVPADSELVLEGKIIPGERVNDGPYMDYAGIPSVNPKAYLFHVTAVSWRDQPIFRGMAVGRPGAEDHQLFVLLSQIGLLDFHGSRIRRALQGALIRHRLFRPFQWVGRFGLLKKRLKGMGKGIIHS